MFVTCLDLEGVLVPEIWIAFAEQTGIDELRLTTRDITDYDKLMVRRLNILDREGLGINDIQAVIAGMAPLPGAHEFLAGLRRRGQVIILSDTFEQFARPLMAQLDWPTLFCHSLKIAGDGRITGYVLRQRDHKRHAVQALHGLNFKVIAGGDSYNDAGMLEEADRGILFRPPNKVIEEFPQYPVATEYAQLDSLIAQAGEQL